MVDRARRAEPAPRDGPGRRAGRRRARRRARRIRGSRPRRTSCGAPARGGQDPAGRRRPAGGGTAGGRGAGHRPRNLRGPGRRSGRTSLRRGASRPRRGPCGRPGCVHRHRRCAERAGHPSAGPEPPVRPPDPRLRRAGHRGDRRGIRWRRGRRGHRRALGPAGAVRRAAAGPAGTDDRHPARGDRKRERAVPHRPGGRRATRDHPRPTPPGRRRDHPRTGRAGERDRGDPGLHRGGPGGRQRSGWRRATPPRPWAPTHRDRCSRSSRRSPCCAPA